MSKLLEIYNNKKLIDSNKIYMFKGGVFYYFLDDDARYMSNKYNFKLTDFGSSVKCGFPIKSLEKYIYLFNNEVIELVSEDNNYNNKIISKLKNIDINDISPRDAYIVLNELVELINE